MPGRTKYILCLLSFLYIVALGGCDNQVRFSSTFDTLNQPASANVTAAIAAKPDASAPVPAPIDVTASEPTPTPTEAVRRTEVAPARSVTLSPYVNAVAFEDLYTKSKNSKSRPDFDYNDFLTNFKIQEIVNGEKNLTDIVIDFYPRAVGAGFDHSLYLILTGVKKTPSRNRDSLPVTRPMFAGTARVTLTYFDALGAQVDEPVETPFDQDVLVYPSTHAIFFEKDQREIISALSNLFPVFNTATSIGANYRVANRNARVQIAFEHPELNPYHDEGFDPATFRVILHPIKTNYDIDIINVDSTNFVSSDGYPWGFIIPTDWRWMKEGVKIDKGYPEFREYRNFLTGRPAAGDYLNWYKYPATDGAEKFLYPSVPWQETIPTSDYN